MITKTSFSRRRFLKTSLASIGALTTSTGLAAQLQLANALGAQSSARFKECARKKALTSKVDALILC